MDKRKKIWSKHLIFNAISSLNLFSFWLLWNVNKKCNLMSMAVSNNPCLYSTIIKIQFYNNEMYWIILKWPLFIDCKGCFLFKHAISILRKWGISDNVKYLLGGCPCSKAKWPGKNYHPLWFWSNTRTTFLCLEIIVSFTRNGTFFLNGYVWIIKSS